jgi:hypothetical protein
MTLEYTILVWGTSESQWSLSPNQSQKALSQHKIKLDGVRSFLVLPLGNGRDALSVAHPN